MYAEEEELPKKPPGPDFATFVKQIVAARRIQNTWIIYQAIKREFQEDLMADSYNNRYTFQMLVVRFELIIACNVELRTLMTAI